MHFRVRHGVFAIAYYVQINKSIYLFSILGSTLAHASTQLTM